MMTRHFRNKYPVTAERIDNKPPPAIVALMSESSSSSPRIAS